MITPPGLCAWPLASPAVAAWLGVHGLLMSGVRERVEAFIDWAWNYFSRDVPIQVLDRTEQERIDWKKNWLNL